MCLKCDFSLKKTKSDYKFLTYVEYMNDFNQPQITHFSSYRYVINILFLRIDIVNYSPSMYCSR